MKSPVSRLLLALTFLSLPLINFGSDELFPGCTDPTACNFDPGATVDDGSCLYGFCELLAVPDEVCIQDGDPISFNVLDNDLIAQGFQFQVVVLLESPCFFIDPEGNIMTGIPAPEDCCGEHTLAYQLCTPDGQICSEPVDVHITVKCDKPDCFLINLEDFASEDGAGGNPGDGGGCASVCENSESTLFVPYDSNSTYSWTVVGGTYVAGSNPAEIIVTWGSAGSGTVFLTITDANGLGRVIELCVDILPGPTASFTTSGYACLGQPMCFTNTSLNADDYFWDFGDGNSSTDISPCWTYAAPGTYEVILTAIKYNYADDGSPLCCCVDTLAMDVEVDNLPGPSIYWISTLCEGDSSCYWTDATNCTNYTWSVYDANGLALPFTGQGNDTICVTWPIGPIGTITLDVTGCDSAYCDNPTTVTVPVISSVADIDGPTEVCENSTHTYTLPKWQGTIYEWTVTGGTLVSGDSTHSATIMWGSAGIGTIHVDYHSEFLAGLPGHEGSDCYGVADLTVTILPEFSLTSFSPSQLCVGQSSFIQAVATPTPNCNWTITPSHPFTGNGTDQITVNWTTPGLYVIEANPVNPADYCNDSQTTVVNVVELLPPDSITGPIEICPEDTAYYTVHTSESGVGFQWTANNGTLLSSFGGTVGVAWGSTGPYSVSVSQYMLSTPGCLSDTITLQVYPIEIQGPMSISGAAACTNEQSTYTLSPAQHPDTQYNWYVTDPTDGSIVGGQGTTGATVQWNNDPGPVVVTVDVILCGDTIPVSLNDTIYSPIVPVITQIGNLCPGVNATLDAGPGFISYAWSTTDATQTTTISAGGNYSVSTIDGNMCAATAYYEANEIDGPPAVISSGDNPVICIPDPHTVTIVAQTNPALKFEWFCNSVSQGPPSTSSSFVHPFAGSVGTYTYHVVVTDTTTGCMSTSLPLDVFESLCDGGGGQPCIPESYTLDINMVPGFPDCSTVDFSVTSTNFTVTGWTFGDGNGSGSASPSHTYSTAGCYYVVVTGDVPEQGTAGFCEVTKDTSICIPIAAYFEFEYLGCDSVCFTDMSTYIADDPSNAINSWTWNFSPGTSSDEDPCHVFPGPGTYPVTLTVQNANGCEVSHTEMITIGSVGTPTISVVPTPVCAGQPSSFSAPATGAVNWYWDFDDGATFTGPNPDHTYTSGGTYDVSVVVSDEDGCTATDTLQITVFPGIPPGEILGELTICEGDSTLLTAPVGYSYLWTTGATTQTIYATVGTYGVTLTDGDGCTRVLDPVEVVELPIPDATVSGNPFICDDGCVTLSTLFQPGSTYQWFDGGNTAIPPEIYASILVCDVSNVGPYTVEVTDQNGCVAVSDPFAVTVVASPSFSITISPDSCAGTPSTLTVVPVEPNVVYTWNNGDTGTSTVTSQAGLYTVIGTDTLTGCWSSASATINPLPDLCAVPTGCYETCNPDTICGPPGLTYQWNMNGGPIAGATDQCLEVTLSGSYSLTATNEFNCTTTSDSLYLIVIDCDSLPCDDVSIDFSYLIENNEPDSCCMTLSYTNNYPDPLKGISISTFDADLDVNLASIDPSLTIQSITSNDVDLANATVGDPLPTGTVPNFIEFCLTNVLNDPQVVIIDWVDFDDMVVCSDTLEFSCPVEPDCLYMQSDTIYCENGETFYEFTVCNPNDAGYDIGYFILDPISPAGIVVDPDSIDVTGTPITPGTCQTFTVQLSGPGIGGQTFCYNILAHESDPVLDPTTLCCSLDTTYCIEIPPCYPCDDVGIEGILNPQDEDCCYDIMLYNNYDPNYFDEIGICVISPQTTMTINNPFGTGWTTSGYTTTSANIVPGTLFNNFVPGGVFQIPEICLETMIAPTQFIEIKWMKDGDVVCSDTLEVFCEPPCGYLFDETISCDPNNPGYYVYNGSLKNTADYTVEEAVITFNDPAMSGYNQTIPLGSLTPGSVYAPLIFNFGPPAMAGDTICFTITLHEKSANGQYLSCCNFEHCIVLPDCGGVPCHCDDEWIAAVNAGFSVSPNMSDPTIITFQMINSSFFMDCDQMVWTFDDGSPPLSVTGAGPVTHTFPTVGLYTVCVKVLRIADDGSQCKRKFCLTIDVGPGPEPLVLFPNPNNGLFKVSLNVGPMAGPVVVDVYDNTMRPVHRAEYNDVGSKDFLEINLTGQAKGTYFVTFQVNDIQVVKQVVIY